MHSRLQYRRKGAAKRCAICDVKFGLIRHYSWRTALCSKKCVDRFKSREEADRRWLLRLCAARQTVAVGMMRFRSEEAAHLTFYANSSCGAVLSPIGETRHANRIRRRHMRFILV